MRVEDLICIYIKQAEKQTSSHLLLLLPSLPPSNRVRGGRVRIYDADVYPG